MLYHAYEMTHAAFSPMRAAARMGQEVMRNPFNPMAETYGSRAISAALEMFINATRRYGKPAFGIEETLVDGVATPVVEEVVWSRPFCQLLHFRRESAAAERRGDDPKVLMIAPMSGHYATLLRGTVRDMLPEPRRLHHRLGRRPRRAAGAGRVRSRRLHRLPDRDDRAAEPGRRADRGDGGLPARHPGDGGGGADGDGREPAAAGVAGADGLADGHRPQPQAAERAGAASVRSAGSRTTSWCWCPGRTRASCGGSIRASCSSRASWR